MTVHGTYRTLSRGQMRSASSVILLQKSKVASVRIFGETLKREAIDDSDNLSRVTEVAHEFSLRR
jgi:predicted nucleotidyltransferase